MNIIEKIEKEQLEKLSSGKQIPDFNPGDTIKVDVKVVEGTRERIQAFEGVCIARGGKGINESFTVRKISYGEGVERVFPLFSPKISNDHSTSPKIVYTSINQPLIFSPDPINEITISKNGKILFVSTSKNLLNSNLSSDLPKPSVPKTTYLPPTQRWIISGTAAM